MLRRQYEVFADERFARLAGLSNGHLYNLRNSRTCRTRRSVFTKTRARVVAIAERRKPRPNGQPGFVRVDTVHQGERNAAKGVYYINTVDEITQYEHIGCVGAICERFLVPVLEALIEAYPFAIQGFHADNGSEYINHRVARLLNKLHIGQFTKSRARHCNDNALVEGKNGSVIRTYLGYDHIPQRFATRVNAFTQGVLSPYLNYHRPCLFPTEQRDAKGRIRHHYRDRDIATPYEKLKSLPEATRFLKPAVSFHTLDAISPCAERPRRRTRDSGRARRDVSSLGAPMGLRRIATPCPAPGRAPCSCGRIPCRDRREPFGTCGQAREPRLRVPTALPTLRASRPQPT